MRANIKSKRYIFDGNAIAVAGQITKPFHEPIPTQAGSTLASIGGVGSARVGKFQFRDILSFASANTKVVGAETQDGVFETVSLSVVEKLNLLDVVTCDRIVARVAGKFPGDPKIAPSEACIVPVGSRFEKLRIGNKVFEKLEVAPDYFNQPEHSCWSGLQKAVASDADRKLLQPLMLPAPNGTPISLPRADQEYDVLGFSIALDNPKPGGVLGAPLVFKVPQFGTVHLGEFFCYPTSRHLVMIRVELGCPCDGDISVCEAIVDGGPYPP